MSPEQAFWAAILGTVMTVVIAPVLARYLSRKDANVANQLTLATASSMTVDTVLKALERESKARIALEERVTDLENKLDIKGDYIEALEKEIEVMQELKVYVKKLITFLKEKGVDFPPPPDGLLDTNPKIKVGKKRL